MDSQTLKAARAGLGWTQGQLAERAAVHYKTIALYETSNRPQIAGDTADKITAALRDGGAIVTGRAIQFEGALTGGEGNPTQSPSTDTPPS